MTLGTFPTRFDRIGRLPALALLIALGFALIAAAWPVASAPAPKERAPTEQGDFDLYSDTIARLRGGEPYYAVAADELRKGGYPLRPFLTFRLPTLATVYAHVPLVAMIVLEGLLALTVVLVWWRRLKPELPERLLLLSLVLLAAGTASLIEPVTGLIHESWAALLMALMIGLRRPGHAVGAVIAGGLALAVRETVLPMIIVMGGLALIERRGTEAVAWAALVAFFALGLFAHAGMVATVVRPDDIASPGWNALLGPRFALNAVAAVSSANVLPGAIAAIILLLSLFGWLAVATGWAARVSLMLLGYGAMLALFARADTFYWSLLVAPLSLVGLIFVPRALATLVSAARGVAQPQS